MNISLNWIKEYVNLDGIDIYELAHRVTVSTAEVEEVTELGKDIKDVVVGKVIGVEKHPNSEKLTIVKVDLGGEIVQSVCGAPNVKEGTLVPFAKLGGSMKKTSNVAKTQVSGVESSGIICSAAELGISEDHSGILVLEGDYKLGTDIKKIIEIDDVIVEIDNKSLTHRPDLWGHYGIAREIAALYGRELKKVEIDDLKGTENLPKLDISIEDAEKCFRYTGITIDNIKVKKSPINMQTRLYYCGMRPISLLVDLTNYLMLEVGQPMHAFDKRLMKKVVVKSFDKPIKFKTLDSAEREITPDTLMICNQDGPVAMAGVMGGENSEVADDTDSILLESANFDGPTTRKGATRVGLRTEASARFEKVLDPEFTELALKRFVKLLKDADKGAAVSSSLTDVYVKKYDSITVTISKPYIDKYIGKKLELEKIGQILSALEFGVKLDGDTFTVDVPSFRATKDVTMKADLVEEVARIYGYGNIEPNTTEVVMEPLLINKERVEDHKIKELLAESHGLSEVHSYIWYDNKANDKLGLGRRDGLMLLNSVVEHMDTLRDSVAPMLLTFAEENRKYFDKFGMFEIGSIFSIKNKKDLAEEHKNLCIMLADKNESEDNLFFKAKGILNSLFKAIKLVEPSYVKAEKALEFPWVHPVKTAEVVLDGDNLGYISIVHPKIKENVDKKLNMVIVEINMFKFHDIKMITPKYKELSKYQEVTLDFNLLIDKAVTFDMLNAELCQFKNNLLISQKFVDIYTGKGIPEDKKSMTFSFRIGSKEGTLSSEQIDGFSKDLIQYIQGKGYSLR